MDSNDPRSKKGIRLAVTVILFILFVALVVAGLMLAGVINLDRKNRGTDGSETATEQNSSEMSTEPNGSETSTTTDSGNSSENSKEGTEGNSTEGANRVSQDIIEHMAPATEVSGITVTDEMLEKGILNEGNKARLMSVMERAAKGGAITIAFIGGSITAGSSASPMATNCFAALTVKWWEETFPTAKITYVNAGIGATDSWLGAHRVREDVLSKKPDLVIAEFAVNDGQGWNQETYDSLLRELLTAESSPAVVSLMIAHKNGSFADKHAPVAFKYQVPIISYSALLSNKLVSWDKVGNSDGTHPDNPGHELIAHLLTAYFRNVLSEINSTPAEEYTVPELSGSLTRCRYTGGKILYSDNTTPESAEGFTAGTVTKILSSDQGWKTDAAGTIKFTVTAREVGVIWLQKSVDPDGTYADYDMYIDGEKKATLSGVVKSWGAHLEYKSEILGDSAESHIIELRPAEGNTGTEFEILGIGISE